MSKAANRKLGYLTTRYPAASHAFIFNEVRRLRDAGIPVETLALRRAGPADRSDIESAAAYRTTGTVRPVSIGLALRATAACLTQDTWPLLKATTRIPTRDSADGTARAPVRLAEAVIVLEMCRRLGLTHLHAHHLASPALVARNVARLSSGRITWSFTAHGSDVNFSTAARLHAIIDGAEFGIAVGRFALPKLREAAGGTSVGPDDLHLVRCGVDLDEYSAPNRGYDDDGTLRLLSVGRLESVKAHEIMLAAFQKIRAAGTDATLTVVGDGPLYESLRRESDELGVAGRVIWRGSLPRRAVIDEYRRADVLCLTSRSEGVPATILEAMATGLPVVATDVGGVAEAVRSGDTGILVPRGDANAVAEAVTQLRDPVLRRRLGRAGWALAAREFNAVSSQRQLECLFERYRAPRSAVARAAGQTLGG